MAVSLARSGRPLRREIPRKRVHQRIVEHLIHETSLLTEHVPTIHATYPDHLMLLEAAEPYPDCYVKVKPDHADYCATGSRDIMSAMFGATGDRVKKMKEAIVIELHDLKYGVYTSEEELPVLDYHLDRAQRGLLCYARFDYNQLLEFAANRQLTVTPSLQPTRRARAQLICALENADRHPVFDNFMELPPELREQIYEHHFKGFPDLLCAPCQPPITMTSREVRKESLPLFFSTCRFAIDHGLFGGAVLVKCLPHTRMFLQRNVAHLDMLRKVTIRISYLDAADDSTAFLMDLEIDPRDGLNNEAHAAMLVNDGPFVGVRRSWGQVCRSEVYHALSDHLKGLEDQRFSMPALNVVRRALNHAVSTEGFQLAAWLRV